MGLVSALRGRFAATDIWLEGSIPDADDGRELEPHEIAAGSLDLSLLAVDGRVPLPPDDGRPLAWIGEPTLPSVRGEDTVEEPHALDAANKGRVPHVSVPLP